MDKEQRILIRSVIRIIKAMDVNQLRALYLFLIHSNLV